MRAPLRDSPVLGQRAQLEVVGTQLETAGELDRAHHRLNRQHDTGHGRFGSQERIVECDVVGHQYSALKQPNQIGGDVDETGAAFQHVTGQAMNLCRPRIHTGIEQTHNRLLNDAARRHGKGGKTYHPRCRRMQTRCLDVDDSPTTMAIDWPLVGHIDSISAPTDIEAGSSHHGTGECPDNPAYQQHVFANTVHASSIATERISNARRGEGKMDTFTPRARDPMETTK